MTVHWPEVRDDRRGVAAPDRTVAPRAGSTPSPSDAYAHAPVHAGSGSGADADVGAAVAVGHPAARRPRPVAPGALLVLGVVLLVVAVVAMVARWQA